MLQKMRELVAGTTAGRVVTAGLIGGALVVPAATANAAERPQAPSDRYERTRSPGESSARTPLLRVNVPEATIARAARYPKSGVAAAELVDRVAARISRRGYDLDCRTYTTRLGARGIVECKGSVRGKRELARQVRRLIREDKIIAPEDSGFYFGPWTVNSQREVRIDWIRFGYLGTPA